MAPDFFDIKTPKFPDFLPKKTIHNDREKNGLDLMGDSIGKQGLCVGTVAMSRMFDIFAKAGKYKVIFRRSIPDVRREYK